VITGDDGGDPKLAVARAHSVFFPPIGDVSYLSESEGEGRIFLNSNT